MTSPSAKIILDSIAPNGVRLTTMEVVMHRFVLAEFNTHRTFSRNSASSRAIPLSKKMVQVSNDPATPVEWGVNQSGMQATSTLLPDQAAAANASWMGARQYAIQYAGLLGELGVHKQIANRLLEPFMWHTVIVSSTEWDNFFKQRCSELAQPEIRVVAEAMMEALYASEPIRVSRGAWHLPYLQDDEYGPSLQTEEQIALSVARCARVSYLTHDGVRDHQADFSLYERLVAADPMHASPLEHVATPLGSRVAPGGNFRGWSQWRQHVERGY